MGVRCTDWHCRFHGIRLVTINRVLCLCFPRANLDEVLVIEQRNRALLLTNISDFRWL